jgi:hypothetical protein
LEFDDDRVIEFNSHVNVQKLWVEGTLQNYRSKAAEPLPSAAKAPHGMND